MLMYNRAGEKDKSEFVGMVNPNLIIDGEEYMIQVIGIICLMICILLEAYTLKKLEKNKKNIVRYLSMIVCKIVSIVCLFLQVQ